MADYVQLRRRMVAHQLAGRGISDRRVLDAMNAVPRELFVAEHLRPSAYDDSPLPIGAGQTISQPYIVALMIQAAHLSGQDRVLEIGAGSGYAAAVMARIAGLVFAIERHGELAEQASDRMRVLGYANVRIRHGDGSGGWPQEAPFDAILVAASGPGVPEVLQRQLAIGGRLVMPIGQPGDPQTLVKVTRTGEDSFATDDLGGVRFVPLVGDHGWDEEAR